MNEIINDQQDYGDIDAVRKSKDRAKKCIETFIVQFSKTISSMMSYVLSQKHKQNTPSITIITIANNAIKGFFNDRKELLVLVQKYSTDEQWKGFIIKLSEGLHSQLKEYCKYRKEILIDMFEKAYPLDSESKGFSFIEFPINLLDGSKELKGILQI